MKWVALFLGLSVLVMLFVFGGDRKADHGPSVAIVEEVARRGVGDFRIPLCSARVRFFNGRTQWVVSDYQLEKGDVVETLVCYHPRMKKATLLVQRVILPIRLPSSKLGGSLPNPIPVQF